MTDPFNLITEDWLKANDFKWHQFDRMPDKHWLLWIGGALRSDTACYAAWAAAPMEVISDEVA